jgi:hypothetical protein
MGRAIVPRPTFAAHFSLDELRVLYFFNHQTANAHLASVFVLLHAICLQACVCECVCLVVRWSFFGTTRSFC